MKKYLAILLALSMIIALAGCTIGPQPEPEKPDPLEEEKKEDAPADSGNAAAEEALKGNVTEAQPGDTVQETEEDKPAEEEEKKEEPELTLGGVVSTVDSYWYESDSGSAEYTDSLGNKMSYRYSVPAFNLDSSDASDMNGEIEAICKPIIEDMKNAEKNGHSLMYTGITYEAYQNGDIISILITVNTTIDVVEYYTFNLNVATGERASGAEMVNYIGITEEAFIEAAQTATKGKFLELYEGLKDSVDYFEEQLAKTMSADMFSLSAPMYLNGAGRLCIIARIYALAGASYYDYILELG